MNDNRDSRFVSRFVAAAPPTGLMMLRQSFQYLFSDRQTGAALMQADQRNRKLPVPSPRIEVSFQCADQAAGIGAPLAM